MQCLRPQLTVQDYQCLNLGSVTYSSVALKKSYLNSLCFHFFICEVGGNNYTYLAIRMK